jgi:hypothetical protein
MIHEGDLIIVRHGNEARGSGADLPGTDPSCALPRFVLAVPHAALGIGLSSRRRAETAEPNS